jgi:hypothetical protein
VITDSAEGVTVLFSKAPAEEVAVGSWDPPSAPFWAHRRLVGLAGPGRARLAVCGRPLAHDGGTASGAVFAVRIEPPR